MQIPQFLFFYCFQIPVDYYLQVGLSVGPVETGNQLKD